MTPYPNAGRPVGPPNPFSGSIANGTTYDSGIIQSQGANISVWVNYSHDLTMHIIQYADPAGTIIVQDTTQAVTAATLVNKTISDGKLFATYRITLANASGSASVKTAAAIIQ